MIYLNILVVHSFKIMSSSVQNNLSKANSPNLIPKAFDLKMLVLHGVSKMIASKNTYI